MGLLKTVLPLTGAVVLLLNLSLAVNPQKFLDALDMKAVGQETVESPIVKQLLFIMSWTRAGLGALAVASYFHGSETRFRIGVALAFGRAPLSALSPRMMAGPRATVGSHPDARSCFGSFHQHVRGLRVSVRVRPGQQGPEDRRAGFL
eukprot:Transcript_28623.p1 GENE.Transcript_28623~~Transcript_28623.p1  ORF type:complete len:148 (-),score=6.37 Transcript_28623:351-794(-)